MQPKRTLTISLHAGLASFVLAALTGCEATQHAAIDAGAAGTGAAIGYEVDRKSPVRSGHRWRGVVCWWAKPSNYGISSNRRKTQYQEGYNKGRSDEVKTLYWAQRDLHRATEEDGQLRRKLVEIPVDEQPHLRRHVDRGTPPRDRGRGMTRFLILNRAASPNRKQPNTKHTL